MNDLRIWCPSLLCLFALGACGNDDPPSPDPSASMDAAVSEAPPRADAGVVDADGAAQADAGCRPAGMPCASPYEMLTCCSRRCTPDESTQSMVCK